MQVKTKGIILKSIPYADNKLIVKIFTEQQGIQSFITNKKNKLQKQGNVYQGLNLVEIDYVHHHEKTIQHFKDFKVYHHYQHIHHQMVKLSIAQFINELLLKSINDNEHYNTNVFKFIEHALLYFDLQESAFENFHLYFMLAFSKYLGFYPQLNEDGASLYFDLFNGRFNDHINNPEFTIDNSTSKLLVELMDLTIESFATLKLNYTQRLSVLNTLVDYYKIHIDQITTFNTLKTLSVVLNA